MKQKALEAMTRATIACWDCGDNGYTYSVKLSKNIGQFITVVIYAGQFIVYQKSILIDDPDFDQIIDQMIIDIAEKTKELV